MHEKRRFVIDSVIFTFDEGKCIQSRRCSKALPSVFVEGQPLSLNITDDIDPDELIATVNACPSGALSWDFVGDDQQPVSEDIEEFKTTARVQADGPLIITGKLFIKHKDGSTETRDRSSFCRCGKSEEKPFCDGSHDIAGWKG
jgi:uncharacterized Fe-S cluster protein YjdI